MTTWGMMNKVFSVGMSVLTRSCLLGAGFVLAGAASAVGADLQVGAPAYRTPIAPAPTYNWTGFYLGGHVGGAWDHRSVDHFSTVTGAPTGTSSTDASGIMGGGQLGYNYMVVPNWVIGVEADISGANLRSTSVSQSPPRAPITQGDSKVDLFGTVRGRVGYAWNNWLFYGTGGFAWAEEDLTRTQLAGTTGNATPGTVESSSATGTGWTAGGGIEWAIVQNWTARIEYLHLDLGTVSVTAPIAERRSDVSLTIDTVRAGLNYKF